MKNKCMSDFVFSRLNIPFNIFSCCGFLDALRRSAEMVTKFRKLLQWLRSSASHIPNELKCRCVSTPRAAQSSLSLSASTLWPKKMEPKIRLGVFSCLTMWRGERKCGHSASWADSVGTAFALPFEVIKYDGENSIKTGWCVLD